MYGVWAALLVGSVTFAFLGLAYTKGCFDERKYGPVAPPDQGPAGSHLGWFEARWARLFRINVLYVVIATRDRLLVVRAGPQALGVNGHVRATREHIIRSENARRAHLSQELSGPDAVSSMFSKDPKGWAIPYAEIRRLVVRRYRQVAWRGAAQLIVERSGAASVTLILEDEGQLASCVRTLEAVAGGVLRVEAGLRAPTSDPEGALRRSIARSGTAGALILAALCASMAVLLAWIRFAQQPVEQRVATGQVVSCTVTQHPKSSSTLQMRLDRDPYALAITLHASDAAELGRACRSHALVNAIYDAPQRGGAGDVYAISYFGGPDIISEEEAERRKRFDDVLAGGMVGCFTATAMSIMIGTSAWRRRVLAHTGPARA